MYEQMQRIESLRSQLYELVDQCNGNLLHPLVIQASQNLDSEIAKTIQPTANVPAQLAV